MEKRHQTKSSSTNDFDSETFYDKLTQLPNRHLFYGRLGQEMAYSKRTGRYIALISVCLADFQPHNDSDSQKIGGLLLFEVANRLKDNVWEIDTVARTRSDEFVVMLNDLTQEKIQSVTQTYIIAAELHTVLKNPYSIFIKYEEDKPIVKEYSCTIEMGVVVFTNNNKNRDDVLKWAERSMHIAKKSRSSRIYFSDTYI